MNPLSRRFFTTPAASRRLTLSLICFGASLALSPLQATPIPQNLGSGLDKLVESHMTIKAAQARGATVVAPFNGYATEVAAGYASLAIMAINSVRWCAST